ncbi:copper transport protein ctr1, variant 2 [Balamuthia mandrillaris]
MHSPTSSASDGGSSGSSSSSSDSAAALFSACCQGSLQEVKRLVLEERLDANTRDRGGATPLHHAAWHGHVPVLKLLLRYSADVNACNEEGSTSLHWASWNGHVEAVSLLLAHNADPNATTNSGETALHWAAYNRHTEVCKRLLWAVGPAGSDAGVRVKDKHGWTPLQKARAAEVQELLRRGLSEEERAVLDKQFEALRKERSAASRPYSEEISQRYYDSGMLDFTDRIEDGFYDAGREVEFAPFDQLLEKLDKQMMEQPDVPLREIILVDSTRDLRLKETKIQAEFLLSQFPHLETKIRMLAMFVSNLMGGIQIDEIAKANEISLLNKHVLDHVRHELRSNVVPLGCITHGVCRHRSILYKYLCDYLNIPCRLVRGSYEDGGHAWNVVYLGTTFYLVDVMNHPTHLYAENSPEAKYYKRMGRVSPVDNSNGVMSSRDAPLRFLGGIGGSSVRLPPGFLSTLLDYSSSASSQQQRLETSELSRCIPLKDFRRADLILYEKLGSGSFGAVYRCSLNGFSCAVKIMDFGTMAQSSNAASLFRRNDHQRLHLKDKQKEDEEEEEEEEEAEHREEDDEEISYIKREIDILESLHHDNIVTYLGHDVLKSQRKIHLFMEYVPLSMASIIKHQRDKVKKPFVPAIIRTYALEVAKGMHYLHSLRSPILHRDIKSSNVLVAFDEHGTPKKVKLCDLYLSSSPLFALCSALCSPLLLTCSSICIVA